MDQVNLAPDLIDRSIDSISRVAEIFRPEHLPFVGLALVPVIIWLYIFLRHQRENKFLALFTFVMGIAAVLPIFILKNEIARIEGLLEQITTSAIATIVLTSLWVGFYEEVGKHWIVKISDRKFFRNVDDAIQLSIIVALGFSFIENVLYFKSIWHNPAIANFWFYFTFRSIGSMFLHIFASGIFGYYYGLARFAKPVLQDEVAYGKKHGVTKWLHRLLHMKSETVFGEEKILEGVILASVLHGAFDFMMGMSQYSADNDQTFGTKFWLLSAIPFLIGGFFWLAYLLDKKENQKNYGGYCEADECDLLEEERSEIKQVTGI